MKLDLLLEEKRLTIKSLPKLLRQVMDDLDTYFKPMFTDIMREVFKSTKVILRRNLAQVQLFSHPHQIRTKYPNWMGDMFLTPAGADPKFRQVMLALENVEKNPRAIALQVGFFYKVEIYGEESDLDKFTPYMRETTSLAINRAVNKIANPQLFHEVTKSEQRKTFLYDLHSEPATLKGFKTWGEKPFIFDLELGQGMTGAEVTALHQGKITVRDLGK